MIHRLQCQSTCSIKLPKIISVYRNLPEGLRYPCKDAIPMLEKINHGKKRHPHIIFDDRLDACLHHRKYELDVKDPNVAELRETVQ